MDLPIGITWRKLPPMRSAVGIGIAVLLAACASAPVPGNGMPASTPSASTGSALSPKTTPTPIVLEGAPPNSVTAGTDYTFQPTVLRGNGRITFAIEGRPAWARFNPATGTLSGVPTVDAVGQSPPITITATNGASAASIGPFTIVVNPPAPGTGPVPSIR
jgi:hypothetical protein